jgi:hypothetical protein
MSQADEPAYTRVYESLVEADDDVIGLVAYALYKQDKRDWIISWRERHGDQPGPQHLDAFVSGKLTPGQHDRYRTAARNILDAYALTAVEAERPLIERRAISDRIETAAKHIEGAGAWWRQIPAGVISALIYTIFLILIAAALRFAGIDLLAIFDAVADRAPPNLPR